MYVLTSYVHLVGQAACRHHGRSTSAVLPELLGVGLYRRTVYVYIHTDVFVLCYTRRIVVVLVLVLCRMAVGYVSDWVGWLSDSCQIAVG